MKIITKLANFLMALGLAASAVYLALSWGAIGEVPVHYMASGEPDRFGAKWFLLLLFGVALLICIVHFTLMALIGRLKGRDLTPGEELASEDIRLALWFVDCGAMSLLLYFMVCSCRGTAFSWLAAGGIFAVMSVGFVVCIVRWMTRKKA